jgi:hypothetical protein
MRRSKATARTVRVTTRNPSGKSIKGDIPRASVTPPDLGAIFVGGPRARSRERPRRRGAPVFTLEPGQERNGVVAHVSR